MNNVIPFPGAVTPPKYQPQYDQPSNFHCPPNWMPQPPDPQVALLNLANALRTQQQSHDAQQAQANHVAQQLIDRMAKERSEERDEAVQHNSATLILAVNEINEMLDPDNPHSVEPTTRLDAILIRTALSLYLEDPHITASASDLARLITNNLLQQRQP